MIEGARGKSDHPAVVDDFDHAQGQMDARQRFASDSDSGDRHSLDFRPSRPIDAGKDVSFRILFLLCGNLLSLYSFFHTEDKKEKFPEAKFIRGRIHSSLS